MFVSKLTIVYLFHLLLVFPYLAYLGYQLDSESSPEHLRQHGQLLKFIALTGAVYQAVLLWQHVSMMYSI